MNDHVLKLIQKAHAEKATFLDLGMCGLTAIPEEILLCASHLKEINFGSWYVKDGKSVKPANNFSYNDFSDILTSLIILTELLELKSLHLAICNIGENGAGSISALSQLTNPNTSENNVWYVMFSKTILPFYAVPFVFIVAYAVMQCLSNCPVCCCGS